MVLEDEGTPRAVGCKPLRRTEAVVRVAALAFAHSKTQQTYRTIAPFLTTPSLRTSRKIAELL